MHSKFHNEDETTMQSRNHVQSGVHKDEQIVYNSSQSTELKSWIPNAKTSNNKPLRPSRSCRLLLEYLTLVINGFEHRTPAGKNIQDEISDIRATSMQCRPRHQTSLQSGSASSPPPQPVARPRIQMLRVTSRKRFMSTRLNSYMAVVPQA